MIMSSDEEVSLVEVEGGGPGNGGSVAGGQRGGSRTAWEGSLDSESGRGSGFPGAGGDNVVSMEEMSGGTGFWSQHGGGAPVSTGEFSDGAPLSTGVWSAHQQDIADLKEKLAEEKLEHTTEVSKLKIQLEATQASEAKRESEVNQLRSQLEASRASETAGASREVADLKSELQRVREELSLANEKVDEYEQELMFNGMCSESPSSPVNESGSGGEGKESAELKIQLDQANEALRLKEEELARARDSLHRIEEQLRQSRQQMTRLSERANNPDSLNLELERVKQLLNTRESELKESQQSAAVGRRELEGVNKRLTYKDGELQEARERLAQSERELKETQTRLGCKEREVEEIQETLQSTLDQLEVVKKDVADCEKKPTPAKMKLEEQRRIKLNKAMEEIEKHKAEASSYKKKVQELEGKMEESLQIKDTELSQWRKRTAELEHSLQTKESELAQWKEGMERIERDLKQAYSQHQKEVLDLQSGREQDKQEFDYEKREFNAKISQLEEDKRVHSSRIGQLEQSIANYDQHIAVLKEQEEELKQNLETTRSEKEHTVLLLKQESEKAEKRIKEVEKDRNDLQTQIFALNEEKDRLATEKLDVEEVCGEFKDEAEKTMADYNKLADEYKQACKDRDENAMKRRNMMSTVAKRNSEIEANEKKIKELKDELAAMQAAMKEQLSVYEEGFKTERTAREKAVEQIKDLKQKIKSLEKDKKDLRDQINKQSASQFHHEFSEDYTSRSPITSPRGIVSPRGGGQYAASPNGGANFPGPGQRH